MMELPSFPPPGYERIPSQVDGIELYAPAQMGQKDLPDVVDFKCPNCGATIAYDVSKSGLACEYCGYTEAPEGEQIGKLAERFEFKVETIQRSLHGWGSERKELACQRCGAVISASPDILTYSCPFCGSNKVLYREPLEDVLRPRFMIPFKYAPEECLEITKHWLGSSWMLPKALQTFAVKKFNPIYIPYWTFNAETRATWTGYVLKQTEVTTYKTSPKTIKDQSYEWQKESGKVQKQFNDLLVPGTTHLNLKVLAQIDYFDTKDLIRYEPGYLAGMQAQAFDFPLEEAWDTARKIMRVRTKAACLDKASTSSLKDLSVSLNFEDESWRYILVPIYTSVYEFNGESFQILINGQTGKIAGPRPVDWLKVWIVAMLILLPGIIVGFLGLSSAGTEEGILISGAGMLLLVIGLVIDFFQVRQAVELEHD